MTMARLSHEYLDRVWQSYLECTVTVAESRYINKSYKRITRQYGIGAQFEKWLFEHGGTVVQHNHDRYLDFCDDATATMFVLIYS